MCDQTEVQYLPGEVVWVKLRALWWPGKVEDYNSLPEEITTSFRKRPIATVKFFQEDSYEYVHKLDLIYHYNCSRKHEFIKKGLDLTRKKSADRPSNVDLFPSDVATAEIMTGGDPNIIRHESFKPEEKPKYESLFGEKKKVGKKKGKDESPLKDKSLRRLKFSSTPPASGWLSRGSSPNIIRPPSNIPRVITHPRFLAKAQNPNGKSDYVMRLLIQKTNYDDIKNSSKEYQCCSCDYRTCRLNVIILHFNTLHSANGDSTLPRSKVYKSRSARSSLSKIKAVGRKSDALKADSIPKKQETSHADAESMEVSHQSDAEVAETEMPKVSPVKKDDKPAKRGRKRKIKVDSDDHDPKKPMVVDSLLADWEEDTEQEQVELEKEREQERLRKEEENRIAAEAEAASAAASATKSKEVFEFDDDDGLDIDLTPSVKGFGRRIPRVIDSAKGKKATPVETKKTNKSKQKKVNDDLASDVDLANDVNSILAETSVPSLPSIPKSSTFSLDVDMDEGQIKNQDDETALQESPKKKATIPNKDDKDGNNEESSNDIDVDEAAKKHKDPVGSALGNEDSTVDSKNCSPEVEFSVDSNLPPQGDSDTGTPVQEGNVPTVVDDIVSEKAEETFQSGNRSPKPVGTGQSTGGGDHNYVIGGSSSRRRRRSLLPIERNDNLDILSMPVVLSEDFAEEETQVVSKVSKPPSVPVSGSHSGRKRRGRIPNAAKTSSSTSKSKDHGKRSSHHSSRSSKTPHRTSKSGPKSPLRSPGPKSPAATAGPKSPIAIAGHKSPSAIASPKSPIAIAGPKSPIAIAGPKSPIAIAGPKSPIAIAGPKSPPAIASPKSPLSVGPKSPLSMIDLKGSMCPPSPVSEPKSPHAKAPKSPSVIGPKSPVSTVGPKSPSPSGPKSPSLSGPRSPPLASPKSPLLVGSVSPVSMEPISPTVTPSSVTKNSSNIKSSKSPKASSEARSPVHVKSPKGSPINQGSKSSTLMLSPKLSPTLSSKGASAVAGSSSKVVCIPNTSTGDIFSAPKMSLPGSVSPPPLVLSSPAKPSSSALSAPKTSTSTSSIKTIKVSMSGARGSSPLLMQKAGAGGGQTRKLMIVQGKGGASQKLVSGSQRVIMQDMGSGKKIVLLTKGSGNLVLSPQQQQKILSASGKLTAGTTQVTVSKAGVASTSSQEVSAGASTSLSSPVAGGSLSPPALVKTEGKKIKIFKSTLPSGQTKGNVVLSTSSGPILVPVSSFASSGSPVFSTMTTTAGGSKSFVLPVGAKIVKGKAGGKMVFQMQSSQSKVSLASKAETKSPQVKLISQPSPSSSPKLTPVSAQSVPQLQAVLPSAKTVRPKPGSPVKQPKGPAQTKSPKKLSMASASLSQPAIPTGGLPVNSQLVQLQPKGKQTTGIIPNPNMKPPTTQIQSKVAATGIKRMAPTTKSSIEASIPSTPDGGNVQVVSNIPVSLEQIQTNLLAAATPSDTTSTAGLSTPTQQIVTVSTEDGGQLMYLIDNSAFLDLDGANQAADGTARTLIIDPTQGNLGNLILAFDNVAQPSASTSDFSFPTPSSGQDILAEALANTQVLQPDTSGSDLSLETSLLSSHSGNALYHSNVPTLSHGVLETSLTLNQPIMTPLQDLSAVSSLQPPPVASTSLELPITMTQPDITISTSSYSSLPIPSATIQSTVFSDAQQVTSFNSTVPILSSEADSESGSAFIESTVPEGESFIAADNTFDTSTESASMPLLDTP